MAGFTGPTLAGGPWWGLGATGYGSTGYTGPTGATGMVLSRLQEGPSPATPLEIASAPTGAFLRPTPGGPSAFEGAPAPTGDAQYASGAWQVGYYDGGAFVPQYSTPVPGFARRLAYGWETPANGLAEIRRKLGITFALPPREPVG